MMHEIENLRVQLYDYSNRLFCFFGTKNIISETDLVELIVDKLDMLISAHNSKTQENYDIDELQARIAKLEVLVKNYGEISANKVNLYSDHRKKIDALEEESKDGRDIEKILGEELIPGNWYHVLLAHSCRNDLFKEFFAIYITNKDCEKGCLKFNIPNIPDHDAENFVEPRVENIKKIKLIKRFSDA